MSAIRRRLQPLSKAKRIYLGLSGPRRRIPCPKCGNPIQAEWGLEGFRFKSECCHWSWFTDTHYLLATTNPPPEGFCAPRGADLL